MKQESKRSWFVLPYLLIVGVAAARLSMSLPFNFVPVLSCLLFFGAKRPKRELVAPCLALMGVDIFLTKIGYGYPISLDHAVTWLWYGMATMLGATLLRRSYTLPRALTGVLLASISFFVASNLAVWMVWNMYPKTVGGLVDCYVAALPFFRNSAISETLATGMIAAFVRWSETRKEAAFMKSTSPVSM